MHIALLEDDTELAELFKLWFEEAGIRCDHFTYGNSFLQAVRKTSWDGVILDWNLPDTSGVEVLREVRQQVDWSLPVLFVTRHDSEEDVVRVLDMGADDYLTKPVTRPMLMARLRAITRRANPLAGKNEVVRYGPYEFDMGRQEVWSGGDKLNLTPRDFELAAFIFSNMGRLMSRSWILEKVWGMNDSVNTRTVDTHMSRVRKKLGLGEKGPFVIKTIYQHGYRLEKGAEVYGS